MTILLCNFSVKLDSFSSPFWMLKYGCLIKIILVYTSHKGKGKVCIRAKWPIRPELILVSVAWSDWEYFYSPLDGMLVHHRVTASIKFPGTNLYTWVERGTVRVKCLAQEHNTMSLARARTQTARSRVERANHETTAPPLYFAQKARKSVFTLISTTVRCFFACLNSSACMEIMIWSRQVYGFGSCNTYSVHCKKNLATFLS